MSTHADITPHQREANLLSLMQRFDAELRKKYNLPDEPESLYLKRTLTPDEFTQIIEAFLLWNYPSMRIVKLFKHFPVKNIFIGYSNSTSSLDCIFIITMEYGDRRVSREEKRVRVDEQLLSDYHTTMNRLLPALTVIGQSGSIERFMSNLSNGPMAEWFASQEFIRNFLWGVRELCQSTHVFIDSFIDIQKALELDILEYFLNLNTKLLTHEIRIDNHKLRTIEIKLTLKPELFLQSINHHQEWYYRFELNRRPGLPVRMSFIDDSMPQRPVPTIWNELFNPETLPDPEDVPHSNQRPERGSAAFQVEDDYWTDGENDDDMD